MAPRLLDPGLLVVLPPRPVLGRDHAVRALVVLAVAHLVAPGGTHRLPVGRIHPVPAPLHDAVALDVPHRFESHLQAGGEVGHGEPGGEGPPGHAAFGGFGEVGRLVRHQLSSEMMVVGAGSVTAPSVFTTAVPRDRNSMV